MGRINGMRTWIARLKCRLFGHCFIPAYEFRQRHGKGKPALFRHQCARCGHWEPWRRMSEMAEFNRIHAVTWLNKP